MRVLQAVRRNMEDLASLEVRVDVSTCRTAPPPPGVLGGPLEACGCVGLGAGVWMGQRAPARVPHLLRMAALVCARVLYSGVSVLLARRC
jgi:hypothetical protein